MACGLNAVRPGLQLAPANTASVTDAAHPDEQGVPQGGSDGENESSDHPEEDTGNLYISLARSAHQRTLAVREMRSTM